MPNFANLRKTSEEQVAAEGQYYRLHLWMPTETRKGDPTVHERGLLRDNLAHVIRRAHDEWREGLASGGFAGEIPTPMVALRQIEGAEALVKNSFYADMDRWRQYRIWRPADMDWFVRCFRQPWGDFSKQQRSWLRNRILSLIFSTCQPRHHLLLSTGDHNVDGMSGLFSRPKLASTPDLVSVYRDHLWAFQRRRVTSLPKARHFERLNREPIPNEVIRIKRRLLDEHVQGRISQIFAQTFFHEYSHTFADTCDYYYVVDIRGRMRAMHGAHYAASQSWGLDVEQRQKRTLGRDRLVPELLAANADSIGCYMARFIEPCNLAYAMSYRIG